jgi:hypothetical protein
MPSHSDSTRGGKVPSKLVMLSRINDKYHGSRCVAYQEQELRVRALGRAFEVKLWGTLGVNTHLARASIGKFLETTLYHGKSLNWFVTLAGAATRRR